MSEPADPLAINLHRYVEVKLTESGFRFYAAHLNWLGFPVPKGCGVGKPLRVSLWELMKVFGPELSAEFTLFEGNTITLLSESRREAGRFRGWGRVTNADT